MGKGFCSSPGGQCVLVGAAHPLDVAGMGLGQTSGDQAAQEVTDDNPPYPPVGFLECDHSAESDGLADCCRELSLSYFGGDPNERFCGLFVIEDQAKGLAGQAGGPRCCSFAGPPQICEQERGLEVWGLECLAMRGLVPGRLIRGWRAAVWIPKFIQSVLISRCQCCGREGLPCGGQLPLVDELACPSGSGAWLSV